MADKCLRRVNVSPSSSSSSSYEPPSSLSSETKPHYLRILAACDSVADSNVVNIRNEDDSGGQVFKITAILFSSLSKPATTAFKFVLAVVLPALVVAWLTIFFLFPLMPAGVTAASAPGHVHLSIQGSHMDPSYSATANKNSVNFPFTRKWLKHKKNLMSQTCPLSEFPPIKVSADSECSEQGCRNVKKEKKKSQQPEFPSKAGPSKPTSAFRKSVDSQHVQSAIDLSGINDPPGKMLKSSLLHERIDKREMWTDELMGSAHSVDMLSSKADAINSNKVAVDSILSGREALQVPDLKKEGDAIHIPPVADPEAEPTRADELTGSVFQSVIELGDSLTDTNSDGISTNNGGVKLSTADDKFAHLTNFDAIMSTPKTSDGIELTPDKWRSPKITDTTTRKDDVVPMNFAGTSGGTSTTTETPDGTSTTPETPDGTSTTPETPDGTSTTTETPDGTSTTTETPGGTSIETPDGTSTTTETPDGTSTTPETPDGTTSDGTSTTPETPDGATPETPDGATPETPDGTTPETPDGTSTTTETPDETSTTTETPGGTSIETPDGTATTPETPDGTSTTPETPDGTSIETPNETSTEIPDETSTTTEKPGGTTPEIPDGTSTEIPDGAVKASGSALDGVDLSIHDMPDFANWRKEFYGNDTRHDGLVVKGHSIGVSGEKGAVPSDPVRLNNYASHECGAKVINSNKEADNLQAVLNENKDQYIIQPCSAKKWLVIELCESVLIKEIQIGNLELFSSIFENFTVSISQTKNGGGKDRPGKDWLSVGSFQAKEERAMQTFNIKQLELYTSYVKVEVISYYGNEHYCPITIIRVHGSSFNDDDDDDDETINAGVGLEKEPELPCTEPPPSSSVEHMLPDSGASRKFVFPPQPAECFLCYTSLGDVPRYCWPAYYQLLDNSTAQPSNLTDYGSATDSNDISLPCDPSSAPDQPVKAPSTGMDPVTEVNSTHQPSNSNDDTTLQVSAENEPTPSALKVQTTPVAAEVSVAVSSTQSVATATIAASVDAVEETTPTAVESIEPTATADSSDHIQPSPPTLAQPPTAAAPASEGSTQHAEPEKDSADPPDVQSEPPPPPAMRSVKKNSAIGSVKNQVKALERNLQVTNRYLEEMSRKSKSQKEDLQRALNQTMKLLHNTTLRLEATVKSYEALKVTTQELSKQVASLQQFIDHNEKMDWLTPVLSISTLLLTLILSQCLPSYRQKATNRQQVEHILEMLPESPVRRLKRRGSTSGVEDHSELADSVSSQHDKQMKRANSCISFDSSHSSELMKSTDNQSPSCTQSSPVPGKRDSLVSSGANIPIEIISPATWRTFNTPDSKASRTRRRKKSLKSKQQLFSVSGNTSIPEESEFSTRTDILPPSDSSCLSKRQPAQCRNVLSS